MEESTKIGTKLLLGVETNLEGVPRDLMIGGGGARQALQFLVNFVSMETRLLTQSVPFHYLHQIMPTFSFW